VLGVPAGDERIQLEAGESRAVASLPLIFEQSIEAAMNTINPDPEKQRKAEEKRRQKQEQREQKRLLEAAEKSLAATAQSGGKDSSEDEQTIHNNITLQ